MILKRQLKITNRIKNLKYNMKERIKAQFYPFLKLCNLIGVKKQENMTAINFLENISNKRKKS